MIDKPNSPRARGVLFVLKGPYDLRVQPLVKFSQDAESARLTKIILSKSTVKPLWSLRDREVACSASDRQGSNFESCVWRTVSSQSSHHPQEVLLAQFSLYVHKGGLKPDSFHFISFCKTPLNTSTVKIANRNLKYCV